MVARLRFGTTLPLAAVLGLAAALAVPACGGGGTNTSSNTGGNGGSGNGDCPTACSGETPVCDPESNTCVGCVPSDDGCGAGKYCSADSKTCLAGCAADADCTAPQICDTLTHQCVNCSSTTPCEAGFVCSPAGECVSGCTDSQPCSNGLACCSGVCTDLSNDPTSCGMCGEACDNLKNATELCVQAQCELGACEGNNADCNQDQSDGCEWDVDIYGPCSCTPGATQDCYTGAAGTKDVGTCKGGIATCDPNGAEWGPCEGQVIPAFDACADNLDNDCDGTPDNDKDLDGDGWTVCQGDCCDSPNVGGCADPNLVNPGAFEVGGNTVDDDCDGTMDNVLAACDAGLASNSATGTDYAKAIDLCQTTTESPSLPQKKWGVISASFALSNGSGSPAANSRSIRQGFGAVTQLAGSSFSVLSTGVAAAKVAPNNASPNYAAFQGGQDMAKTSPVPADWLAANGNNFPNAPGCPEPQGGTTAHDPIMLKVRVRVPTNAKSFDVSTNFMSSEYPEWVCSPYNDFFLALLDSTFAPGAGQAGNPADKNLAFYKTGNSVYPVGVNLAFGNTGLFTQCQNTATGCGGGAVPGNTNTCAGTTQLVGTGMDDPNLPSQFANDPAYCANNAKFAGGGTGWLTTTGNVKPGETIDLRFVVWDTGDQWYDSVALIDNFLWSLDASTPGTHQ